MIDGRKANEDLIPTIQMFEGFGELTVGGSVSGGDSTRVVFTALAMLNDPMVNSYFLAQKLKLSDRMTKTKIFPRDGMALLNGKTFSEPQEEVLELPVEQENA
ncbi:hypothetical protein LCGC14_1116830 [marine sediment metagenome]|uniref:Uncharacterized protein n=1 Tax=marine sediment metagenome TaxID=412755 RepID=A0A0F9PN67_9ZZZZ